MINYQKPIIAIAGPTASGKSSLAIKLAKEINGYIINADSRQIYKELKIGTAQPTPEKVEDNYWIIDGIRHYLYAHVSIEDNYSLFKYQEDVQRVLNKADGIPILVGGTGLYIDSILYNYDLKDKEDNKYEREDLDKYSLKELQNLIDEKILNKLNNSDRNNPRRLIRILERGGLNRKKEEPLNTLYLFIDMDEEQLKDRIEKRTKEMIENGLIEENKELIERGFTYDLPALQSIGYQEFKKYLDKDKTIENIQEEIVLHTIQYAKRQRTWFRKNEDVIKIKNYDQAQEHALNFLSIS